LKGEGEMIFTKKKENKTNLEKEIDALIKNLSTISTIDSEDYEETLSKIERLATLKEKLEKAKCNENKVSKDTLVVVAGNLLGIGLILGYERLNIITSKALSFVIRGRA